MENENEDQNQDTRANINREIRELAHRAGCNTNITDELIDRQATLEDARQSILDDVIGRGRTPLRPHNDETVDKPTVLRRALSEALHTRVDPSFEPSGPARGYIGLSIPEIARELLRRSGESVAGFSPSTLITRALHTTSDFPLILGETVGRTLRQS